ncbi:hypothetical protein MNBD_ACTINO02-2097 [hydrothermal vent metagenome]|uniref:Uncharacterized protein n=1 Tax=hydrothermal vent metagenome TaxID=652676 RepID=A0A3B0SVG4_9ZZZZ
MVWRPVRRELFRNKLLWGVTIVVVVALVGYGLLSRADTSSGTVASPSSTSTVAVTSTSTTTTPSTTTTSTTSTTVPVTTTVAIVWEPGTVTCAEVEGHIPYGVDDFSDGGTTGLITVRWGDNQSLTLQYLDDPTCTVDSNAWRFLIKHVLTGALQYFSNERCSFYKGLADSENPPRNLGSVMSLAAPACLDQW